MLVVVVCSGGMIVSSQWLKSILTSQPTSKNDSYDLITCHCVQIACGRCVWLLGSRIHSFIYTDDALVP